MWALGALLLTACASAPKYGGATRGREPIARVLLKEGAGALVISASGPYQIKTDGGIGLTGSDRAGTIRVSRAGNSLSVQLNPQGSTSVADAGVVVVPERGTELSFDGIAYPGHMTVGTAGTRSLRLLNVVPLETYLEGVVPHEIGNPGRDAFSAMEAQAITARTYAMTRIAERKNAPFDLHAGVMDQVYRGNQRKNALASAALRGTRGVVLAFDGELGRTYYSATCGGHTSDIELAWPHRDPAPYLRGGRDRDGRDRSGRETFCNWAKNFRWRYSFSGSELGAILRRTIPAELGVSDDRVGSLVDVRVVERSRSGRVLVLEIETTAGTFVVRADRIRWVLMTDVDVGRILRSTMFNLHKSYDGGRLSSVSIAGGGNGHGVGMCQNGAIGMARRGYNQRMILAHYYPGCELERRY